MATPDGNVLDRTGDGEWRLWHYDPTQADILPGDPIQAGTWATIPGYHSLVPMADGRILDWAAMKDDGSSDGSWRLWSYDAGQADILPGNPVQQGKWATIAGAGAAIYAMRDGKVLDLKGDGSWRLWNYDAGQADILPGNPVRQARWATISTAGDLLVMKDGLVLTVEIDGSWRLWNYDPTQADILPGDPVQQGKWATIDLFSQIRVMPDGKVLTLKADGSWRLWNYDPSQADILPGDPVQQGKWATIADPQPVTG
jgi:hypothetical protein